jgi:ribosomal-protein-alanine N-acetyltransferase
VEAGGRAPNRDNSRVHELTTERMWLRAWRPEDRTPFAALNADPEVMRHFPTLLSRRESDALADRIEAHLDGEGWGLWAMEQRSTGAFLGFTGLARPIFDAPFMPAVEIGWRLARDAWGQGYASEAARVSTTFAFDDIGLEEIVSMAVVANARSRAVMERLGMRRDPAEDFDHPLVAEPHLRRHVLYRLAAAEWRAAGG